MMAFFRRLTFLGIAPATLFVAGCNGKTAPPAPASAAPPATALPSAAAPATTGAPTPALRAVYPLDPGPPNPLATRYCSAVLEAPSKRKDACCPSSPATYDLTSECVRTLTYAIDHDALKVDPADLDRCAAAVAERTSGCDWVTAPGAALPPACQGIFKGSIEE